LIFIDLIGLSIATLFIVKILNAPASLLFITACTATTILCNLVFKSYKQLWRYTSFREIQNVFMANIVAVSCLVLLNSTSVINTTILTLFNFYAIFFLYSLGVRGCRRFYVSQTTTQTNPTNTNVNTLIIRSAVNFERLL
jgi:FlaA1/EpsC-like NDP-sugar epimerase